MDWYYVDKSKLSNQEIDSLLEDDKKKGFEGTIYGVDS